MSKCSARIGIGGALLALALALGGAGAPAVAGADDLATSVLSASVPGPAATFTEVEASANCGGALVSGGGARLAESTATVEANGIHIDGSFPSPDGHAQSSDGDQDPTRWAAAGGSGGAVPTDAQTFAYALCMSSGPTTTEVVVAAAPGPAATYQMIHTTATCPAGTRLLSGGARTTPGTVGSLKPNGSFPSDASGNPLLSGTDPSSWTVTGLNGGGGNLGNTTFAFAICATGGSLPTVSIEHAQWPGPALATTAVQQTVACPDATTLLGGGGFISDAFALPGSQGDHLTGSYPSDASGAPVASGPASAWTVASHTGGENSGSLTQTDVWAMCASAPGAAPPNAPPYGVAGPSGPAGGLAVPAERTPPRALGRAVVGTVLAASRGDWSNQPTTYHLSWLRCRSTGGTCEAIPGAGNARYRLTIRDLGARLRLRVTAGNPAGASRPAVSSATTSVRSPRALAARTIRALLRDELAPTGRAAAVAGILARGGSVLPFVAPEAGRATVTWCASVSGAKIPVAAGSERFSGARFLTLDVKLTAAGRRLLAGTKRVRVTALGVFTPRGKEPVSASQGFDLVAVVRSPTGSVRQLPMSFEANLGQTDPRVRFLARSRGATVFLTAGGAVLAVTRSLPGGRAGPPDVLRIRLARARQPAAIVGVDRLAGTVNYLSGAHLSRSYTGVPTYRAVLYRSVYRRVDLRYRGIGARLEYAFTLAPGARPSAITIELLGARGVRVDRGGALHIRLAHSTIVQSPPAIYQEAGGIRHVIRGCYVVRGPRAIGFEVGTYDRRRGLIIDPTIASASRVHGNAYATLLHGSGQDAGRAVAVDGAGGAYLTGDTSSPDFPTARALHGEARAPGVSAFVVKLSPRGSVIYSTYLGGPGFTAGHGIAVDSTGAAYVTGATSSTGFPTTPGAIQRSYGGGPFDAFVTKLDPSGARLVYSTFLGDTHYDEGNAIAVDGAGRAVVTGRTVSPDFPAVGHLQPHVYGGAFVARLNPAGTALSYSTVFGGNDTGATGNHGDAGFAVAVDGAGNAYVTGVTNATHFPTIDPLQRSLAGGSDAFAIKINAAGTAVDYCTYLGGSGDEIGRAVAANNAGDAYIAGETTSRDFPTVRAFQHRNRSSHEAGSNAFVAKISPGGRRLLFSTYLGGTGDDSAGALALDRAGNVYLTGETNSTDFPLAHARQRVNAGAGDAFITEFASTGSSLVRSTHLGGAGTDAGTGIAVTAAGGVDVTGLTASSDFPARAARGGHAVSARAAASGAFVVALPGWGRR